MTRLEDLVRDSLRAEASDVRATPELWNRVEDRIGARRRTGRLALVGGTALALVVGAFAVPRLLDDGGARPDVVVDGQPSPGATPSPGTTGDDATAGHPIPTWFLAVNGERLVSVRTSNAEVGGSMALGVRPEALAVRPSVDGQVMEIAYVARSGDEWQLRLRIPFDMTSDEVLVDLGDRNWADRLLDSYPVQVGPVEVAPPGLAWSPDGEVLTWLATSITDGVPTTEVVSYDVPRATQDQLQETGPGPEGLRTVLGRKVLADGASAGTLTLKDLTWDATYEDGMVGRAFVVGEGRAWQLEVVRDATGVIDFTGLDPIDLAVDFDQAGAGFGVYALRTVGVEPATFELVQVADGPQGWSLVDQQPITTDAADLASAADVTVVSLGDRLIVHRDGATVGSSDLDALTGEWGPVDVVTVPWTATYVPPDGEPGPEPTQDVDAQPDLTLLPGFVVTTDGASIDLRRSNGERMQTLYRLSGIEDGRILGLDVRPGSSTEDLTVAFTTGDAEGRATAWSLRGRADDQAGLAVVVTRWDDAHQPSPNAMADPDGERIVPAFSGDGAFVGYAELDGERAGVRFFGWLPDADVPGTSRTADDNVAFGVTDAPLTLEGISDLASVGSDAQRGYVARFTTSGGSVLECEYERQGDGALAELGCTARWGEGGVVDATNRVVLVRRGSSTVLVDADQTRDTFSEVQWDLPDELRGAVDPARTWMTGTGEYAFVGDLERAWLVTPQGHQLLGEGMAWVAAVR